MSRKDARVSPVKSPAKSPPKSPGRIVNGAVPDPGTASLTMVTSPKQNKHSNKAKTPPSTGKNKHTLDIKIPWPTSYDGHEHPFKTVLEQTQEKECAQMKQRLLHSVCAFSNGYDVPNSDSESASRDDCDVIYTSSPLVAMAASDDAELPNDVTNYNNRPLPPLDIASANDAKDPPELSPMSAQIERIRRKRGRKSKSDLEILASAKAADRIRLREVKKRKCKMLKDPSAGSNNANQRSQQEPNSNIEIMQKPKLPAHARNVIDSRTLDACSKKEVPFTKLKSSVNTYFGAADRLRQGEKFRVIAKRLDPEGRAQYLVEWLGAVPGTGAGAAGKAKR